VTRRRALRAAVWAGGLAPAAWIVWRALHGSLGANPVETLEHATGDWALRLLLATLAVSPLRRLTGWHALIAERRSLGLLTFGYAACHFTIWAVLDLGLDPAAIVEDVRKRPYVTVGFTAFVLLVPLAVTSTRSWMRRLGRRWTSLHRLVYVAAGLAVLHYAWLVKADLRPPLAYGAALAALLLLRLPLRRRGMRGLRRPRPARARPVGPPNGAAGANQSV
jgi:sulfoxide reductase heme-binding subunit YedZ